MIRQLGTFLICICLAVPSWSQIRPPKSTRPFVNSGGSDYYVGLDRGKPLIQVSILSGVQSPGIYNIPIGTNLSELLSYAGGASNNADLSDIQIRSQTKDKQYNSKRVDLKGLMSDKNSLPALQNQDVIYISQSDDGLNNTIKWLTMGSLAASILAAIVIIDDRN